MRPSWMPSIGDIIFILLLQLIFVFIPNFIFGDGSSGWHLVTGHYVLDHMQIPRTDLISYTFAEKPWVAYEWLFDAFIALLDKIAGLRLVAVACCSAIAWLFLLLYNDCRRRGCHFLPAMLLCIGAALISAIHWLARPHLVTFFGVYLFTRFLNEYVENKISKKKLYLILALSMLVWANSHPAFLMGIVIVGIYLVSDLFVLLCTAYRTKKTPQEVATVSTDARGPSETAQTTEPVEPAETKEAAEAKEVEETKAADDASEPAIQQIKQIKQESPVLIERIKTLAACLAIVIVVSLINPYGIELYKYIIEYLHQTAVISQTDEYASPVFHGQLQTVLLELMFFALAAGLVCSSKKPSLPAFLTVLAYAHLSLASKRNMPLFVIVATPFIAGLFANCKLNTFAGLEKLHAGRLLSPLMKVWKQSGQTMDSMEFICTRHALPIAAVLILSLSCFKNGNLLGAELVRSDFDPKTKPTDTLECLSKAKLDEKQGFSFDNWGGYIRYKTNMRVFIDDRVDFYGEKFYLKYADVATGQPNWKDVLNQFNINWVLFPENSILVSNLKGNPAWKLICQDQASCLYQRQTEPAASKTVSSESQTEPAASKTD